MNDTTRLHHVAALRTAVTIFCMTALGCGGTVMTSDAGSGAVGVTPVVAQAPVDAGCLGLDLPNGACGPLSFSAVCGLLQTTVLRSGNAVDDAAGAKMGLALLTTCSPAPQQRTMSATDPTLIDDAGAPLAPRTETLVVAGGSYTQRYVNWLETTGNSTVYDSSNATIASLSLRNGTVIASAPIAEFGPGRDMFLLEFIRSRPGGPLSIVAYGYFSPGTTAAAWFFEHRVLAQPAVFTDTWYVVRWVDTDQNGLPGAADQFETLGAGR